MHHAAPTRDGNGLVITGRASLHHLDQTPDTPGECHTGNTYSKAAFTLLVGTLDPTGLENLTETINESRRIGLTHEDEIELKRQQENTGG